MRIIPLSRENTISEEIFNLQCDLVTNSFQVMLKEQPGHSIWAGALAGVIEKTASLISSAVTGRTYQHFIHFRA